MQNEPSSQLPGSGDQLVATDSSGFNMSSETSELDMPRVPQVKQPDYVVAAQHPLRSRLIWGALTLTLVLLAGSTAFVLTRRDNSNTAQIQAGKFGVVSLPLSQLNLPAIPTDIAEGLRIKGQ